MSNMKEQLERTARELAEAKATIKKLQHQKQDLQYQVAWGLSEVKSLNNKLKEQSPLIDMDNMKKV